MINFIIICHHLGIISGHSGAGGDRRAGVGGLLWQLLLIFVVVIIIWHILISIGYLLIGTAIQICEYARYRNSLGGHFTELLLLVDTTVFGVCGSDMFLDFLLLCTSGRCNHCCCHHGRWPGIGSTMHIRSWRHHTLTNITFGPY